MESGDTFAVKSFKGAYTKAAQIELLVKCTSPYIVRVDEVYDNEGSLHVVMELAEKGDLRTFIEKCKITEQETSYFIKEILMALLYLHETAQIIHGDLKLENVIITNDFRVKLIDFGGAIEFSNARPVVSLQKLVGTVAYMAPECWNGDYSPASDMWALGVIASKLLFNEPPTGHYESCGSLSESRINEKVSTMYNFGGGKDVLQDKYKRSHLRMQGLFKEGVDYQARRKNISKRSYETSLDKSSTGKLDSSAIEKLRPNRALTNLNKVPLIYQAVYITYESILSLIIFQSEFVTIHQHKMWRNEQEGNLIYGRGSIPKENETFREVLIKEVEESPYLVWMVALIDHLVYDNEAYGVKIMEKLEKAKVEIRDEEAVEMIKKIKKLTSKSVEAYFGYLNKADEKVYEHLKKICNALFGSPLSPARIVGVFGCGCKFISLNSSETFSQPDPKNTEAVVRIEQISRDRYRIYPAGEELKLAKERKKIENERHKIKYLMQAIKGSISYYNELMELSKYEHNSIPTFFCMKCAASTKQYLLLKCEHIVCANCVLKEIAENLEDQSIFPCQCCIENCKAIIPKSDLEKICDPKKYCLFEASKGGEVCIACETVEPPIISLNGYTFCEKCATKYKNVGEEPICFIRKVGAVPEKPKCCKEDCTETKLCKAHEGTCGLYFCKLHIKDAIDSIHGQNGINENWQAKQINVQIVGRIVRNW
eukprot:TRINITY_DN121091_c2_g1_i1.p1 TRINITY_DN121091_c2_g1~~TRINITY_DN121091_c2_g1_i1.p1  ORF type:complete len:711 (-),score=79.37 TRINITY_DN121091_c2_g1_i1:829-2961(-)